MEKPIKLKPGLYSIFLEHLKQIALLYGYNLVVHGSMDRDLDLIAIPWTEKPIDSDLMIKEFQEYLTGKIEVDPKGKVPYTMMPSGRRSYVIDLNRGNKNGEWVRFEDKEYYLDISVTPTLRQIVESTFKLLDEDREIVYDDETVNEYIKKVLK